MSDAILQLPSVPEGLREAAQRGILIPFIGAGVSRLAGCPDWNTFADGALRIFVDQKKLSYSELAQINQLSPRIKLSLARALEEEHNIPINFQEILHPTGGHDHRQGRRLYQALSKLATTFITTNYDRWLDNELQQPGLSVTEEEQPTGTIEDSSRRILYRPQEFTPAELSRANTVIHLHGSLREPRGMILTTSDYLKHYSNDRSQNENRVLTLLEHLFEHKCVLFIGYGLEELEILEYVILKAGRGVSRPRPQEVRHYLLQGFFLHQEPLLRSLKKYYRRECQIEVVPFQRDQNDWGQLIDVVEHLALSIPSSAPGVLQKAQEMEDLLKEDPLNG